MVDRGASRQGAVRLCETAVIGQRSKSGRCAVPILVAADMVEVRRAGCIVRQVEARGGDGAHAGFEAIPARATIGDDGVLEGDSLAGQTRLIDAPSVGGSCVATQRDVGQARSA